MVAPILPLFVGASFALQTVYNMGKASDTRRYWDSYYRNTGFRPRYPYRAGVYDYLKNDAWMMGAFGRTSGIYRKNFRKYR